MCVDLSRGYRKKISVHGRSPHPSSNLLADEFCEDVVCDRLDFALRQAGRMRVARRVVAEILPLQPVAVRILISIFVKMRHFSSRPTARDHFDQLIATKMGLMQIGGSARRA